MENSTTLHGWGPGNLLTPSFILKTWTRSQVWKCTTPNVWFEVTDGWMGGWGRFSSFIFFLHLVGGWESSIPPPFLPSPPLPMRYRGERLPNGPGPCMWSCPYVFGEMWGSPAPKFPRLPSFAPFYTISLVFAYYVISITSGMSWAAFTGNECPWGRGRTAHPGIFLGPPPLERVKWGKNK